MTAASDHRVSTPAGGRSITHRHPVVRFVLFAVAALIVAVGVTYVAGSKWLIRHEQLHLFDASRQRLIDVDIAVRRDTDMKADAGMLTMPVAIINHGNTMKFTDYSFLANIFAARGYMAVSIQHDLDTDTPLVTKVGEPYVGRKPVYDRDVANILFVRDQLKKTRPHADYDHLTLAGHSNGGDISVYFAKLHPELVKKVVTLDNLRVPLQGAIKVLSFRSKDPDFVPDAGVVPTDEICQKTGIKVVNTQYQHTQMTDHGPESMKESIEGELNKFLDEDSQLSPVNTDKIDVPAPPPAPATVAKSPGHKIQ